MLRSLFGGYADEGEADQGQQSLQQGQQQERSVFEFQPQDGEFVQDDQVLRAIWDSGRPTASGASGGNVGSGSTAVTQISPQGEGQQQQNQKERASRAGSSEIRFGSDETPEERRERQRLEGRINVAKTKRGEQKLDTVADAMDYCRELIDVQLKRAKDQQAKMNESIYGDAHARKAITTLLPDQYIRHLFLSTTRSRDAWPRIRPLFGTPPYNFLRPEDAGTIRASGIAAGRTNMTYDRANETAAYAQFGAGHLVDDFLREYRVVTIQEPRDTDTLPCDIQRIGPQRPIYMNVRVPKRSKEERLELLKDISKRRAVLFPAVGEVLNVKYSSGLQQVWGSKANNLANAKVMVKSMVPRSATGSTAAIMAVRVS
jgi:hypothetical protein